MNNVNLLASATAGTKPVNGKTNTCENCAHDAPSFANLLKNTQSTTATLGEQRELAGEAAATPQTGDQLTQSLSASILMAFAANDSLLDEETAGELVAPNGETAEKVISAQILDPAIPTPPASAIAPAPVPLFTGTELKNQSNIAGMTIPGETPEKPGEPATTPQKDMPATPVTPEGQKLANMAAAPASEQGNRPQGIVSAQANDNLRGTPSAPQTTAGASQAQGIKPENAEMKTAPAIGTPAGTGSATGKPELAPERGAPLPKTQIESRAQAETKVQTVREAQSESGAQIKSAPSAEARPASSLNEPASQTGLPRVEIKTGNQAQSATAVPAEDADASSSETKETVANAQPASSPAGNAAAEPSRPSSPAASVAALNTSASKAGTNPPTIGELATAASNDDTPLSATTANDGEAPTKDNSSDNGERLASLTQKSKATGKTTPVFQAVDSAAQQSMKVSDLVTPAMTTTPIGDVARLEGMMGATPTANNPALPQVPLNSLAVHIAAQAKAGNQQFNIRLDPPELGRIDIRLEIGRDGQTLTHLAVEKPETLDLLRQDARQLERALQNAGLDTREGAVSFSLKEDNRNKQQGMNSEQDGPQQTTDDASDPDETTELIQTRTMNVTSGLDISI